MDNKEDYKIDKEDVPLEKLNKEEKKEMFSEGDSFTEKFVKRLIILAVESGASDIFFEPQEEDMRVRLRVDGLLCEAESCSVKYSSSIVSYIKVISSLDIAEHRFPQDGRFRMQINSKPVDFRVSVIATNLGEKVVLRVLDKGNIKLDLDTLSFDTQSIEVLKANLRKPYGMIIVCG
ncbi:MAG: Flp pilus assembly complex ATPase component TadA, partial [Candidatus Omnitrophica bacterium]|nr:Flp pilus assembly complex ATPase component TadA [Candidatus Omnitrophota bacterium]MCK5492751.1 Flp pilus assembly complex ATPase component TadA [Candidatus Omnitrophota bacterium]